jgi:hypothetical protein
MDNKEQIEWTPKDPLIKPERKDIIVIIGDRGGAEYRSQANLLDWYFHANHITFQQHRAGFKFYRLWHFTILRDRYVKCNYGNEIKGDTDYEDMAIIPHQFMEAKFSINNPNARIAAIDVCCHNVTPGARKMRLVREALDNLIAHFKKDA